MDSPKKCVHCGTGPVRRPRGLCWRCYYTPGVRKKYPKTAHYTSRVGSGLNVRFATPASIPTFALPGSSEKVDVMAIRARLKQDLWHPQDAVF